METEIIENLDTPKRPTFLKVLCILSFIGSGFGILMCTLSALFADKLLAMMMSSPGFDAEKQADNIHALQAGPMYFLIAGVLILISLFGVIQMWKMKKIGMYIYVAVSIIGFVLPILMTDMAISYFALFITVAFIVMYAVNFKHLK